MGVITLTLISSGALASGSNPPLWVIATAGLAIGLGTYLGGWRIIRTMGKGLTEIEPPQGFAAESSATTVILASSHLGFALSTTQVVSGAIPGTLGVAVTALVAIAAAGGLYAAGRREPVHAGNVNDVPAPV
ncbi:inorganic phosphate transporter [Nonomuraea angiospora]